jgi:hypothetical protein
MSGCDDRSPVEREDDRAQQGVLGILLHIYPGQYSIEEVVREMTAEPDDVIARDRVENAIRELVAAGLVHRHGQFVFVTRAAVRSGELRI